MHWQIRFNIILIASSTIYVVPLEKKISTIINHQLLTAKREHLRSFHELSKFCHIYELSLQFVFKAYIFDRKNMLTVFENMFFKSSLLWTLMKSIVLYFTVSCQQQPPASDIDNLHCFLNWIFLSMGWTWIFHQSIDFSSGWFMKTKRRNFHYHWFDSLFSGTPDEPQSKQEKTSRTCKLLNMFSLSKSLQLDKRSWDS